MRVGRIVPALALERVDTGVENLDERKVGVEDVGDCPELGVHRCQVGVVARDGRLDVVDIGLQSTTEEHVQQQHDCQPSGDKRRLGGIAFDHVVRTLSGLYQYARKSPAFMISRMKLVA